MINKETLISFARLNNLRPWQQEKHYIQNIILIALSNYPLVFKGGTYLWFFHGLNRFSEDLDFTAVERLSLDLDQKTSHALKLFGVENTIKKISDEERSFSFRISAKGPLNTSDIDLCHVYVEISKREKVILKPLSFELNNAAYSLPVKIISGMSLDELASEKVRAIITRGAVRDVYDLFFLIRKKNAKFNLKIINEKLKYYDIAFSKELFYKKLEKKKKEWDKELKQLVFGKFPKHEDAITEIKKWAV